MQQMKAVTCQAYGGPEVLQIAERPVPTPAANELLIKVKAASITTADSMMRLGQPRFARLFLGLRKPKQSTAGTGFSGEIIAKGSDVTEFEVNDQVFGESLFGYGSQAEFLLIKKDSLLLTKPEGISHQQAACLCDGYLTSYNFLVAIGQLQAGQKVLINGAAGSLGSAATQIAHHIGAKVTAVAGKDNQEFLAAQKVDLCINYQIKNQQAQPSFLSQKEYQNQFDLIFDCVGKLNFTRCKPLLKKNGLYLTPVLSLNSLAAMLLPSCPLTSQGKKAKFSATGMLATAELKPMLSSIRQHLLAGSYQPVIEQVYDMSNIRQAHQYIDSGHKRGNLILTL